jgi:hypothetical protein
MKTKIKKRIASQRHKSEPSGPISQEDFANIVGETQQFISRLCRFSVLSPNGTLRDWSIQYLRFQFGIIYARRGWKGLAIAWGDREDDERY